MLAIEERYEEIKEKKREVEHQIQVLEVQKDIIDKELDHCMQLNSDYENELQRMKELANIIINNSKKKE